MIFEVLPEQARRELDGPRHKIPPEVAGENSGQKIERAGQDEKPSRQTVQAPTPAVLIENFVGPARADGRTHVLEKWNAVRPAAMLMVAADG